MLRKVGDVHQNIKAAARAQGFCPGKQALVRRITHPKDTWVLEAGVPIKWLQSMA
jgi:hypothetical protein